MMTIAPLMIEHRLIERMIAILQKHIETVSSATEIDLSLVEQGVDFLRTYADHCHHGKEEDILFKSLKSKKLTDTQDRILQELVEEHARARKTVANLSAAAGKAREGRNEAFLVIDQLVRKIIELYPLHIGKEDKHFFIPIMDYYTQEEQDEMLRDFASFDQTIIHDKYRTLVEGYEGASSQAVAPDTSRGFGKAYECTVCGYIYQPEIGDPDHGIAAGTPFHELPDDWVCPVCGAEKDMFIKVSE